MTRILRSSSTPDRRSRTRQSNGPAIRVLGARHGGAARNGGLLRSLRGISKKMMVKTLREMEESGVLTRHDAGTVPPAV